MLLQRPQTFEQFGVVQLSDFASTAQGSETSGKSRCHGLSSASASSMF